MKHGSDWYKREPNAYLGGVQGFTAKEHAVFSVVLDLIYSHGGSVNNDPSWFAGWIKDMGAASVRKAIDALVAAGKLDVEGDQLTQKRAKTEAKTKENLRETREKSGKKGGIASGKSRTTSNEINSLDEAPASPREEKRREDSKVEAKASPKTKGSRLSPDWFLPASWGEWAMDNGAWHDLVRSEADQFKDYWISAAGAKAVKVDWEATWRNWVRRALKNTKPQLKAINGGQHGQRNDNSQNANMAGNAALEQIARLAKLR